MSLPILRFPGAATHLPKLPVYLRDFLGIHLRESEGDFVVFDGDESWRQAEPVLSAGESVDLSTSTKHEISRRLLCAIPTTSHQFFRDNPYDLSFQFHEESELFRCYKLGQLAATAPLDEIRRVLREEVLPMMLKMGATNAVPIVVDSTLQQSTLSASKMMLLLRGNDIATAQRLAMDAKAYDGILPKAFDISAYVVALTRLLPIAFTLPVDRAECVWHFIAPRCFEFHHVRCVSLFDALGLRTKPLTGEEQAPASLQQIRRVQSRAFLLMCVDAVNRIMSFNNDWRNFLNENGEVDFGSQLQAYSTMHLLFADMASMGSSENAYDQRVRAMAVLDKISNFVAALGARGPSEAHIFRMLFSEEHKNLLNEIIMHAVSNKSLASSLMKLTMASYKNLFSFYVLDMGLSGPDLAQAIEDRIRTQRNLHHGAFLKGDAFHMAFGSSSGSVSAELVIVAYINLLCLALAPDVFLGIT